jgi:hypothetical protein
MTGMHVACYDSDIAELYIQANKFLRLQPCSLYAQESMCGQCMVAVSFVGYGMPLHDVVTSLSKRLYFRPCRISKPGGSTHPSLFAS